MSKLHSEDFMRLFLQEQHRVYTFIASLLPDRIDAEEVFQEASLAIWQNQAKFDRQRAFVPWACGVARNIVLKHLRQKRRDRLRLSNEVVEQLAQQQQLSQPILDSRLDALKLCLSRLDQQSRSLLERCYQRNRLIKEIAVEDNTTANAIYLQLRRIRQGLLDCVNRRLIAEAQP
jgi:RNA polymerase sigma-70 factor (ECF subfamily)